MVAVVVVPVTTEGCFLAKPSINTITMVIQVLFLVARIVKGVVVVAPETSAPKIWWLHWEQHPTEVQESSVFYREFPRLRLQARLMEPIIGVAVAEEVEMQVNPEMAESAEEEVVVVVVLPPLLVELVEDWP